MASLFIVASDTDCPDCGSPDATPISGARGDVASGERCVYRCNDCGWLWDAVMPEPASRYEGDGVFAENH